MAGVNYTFFSKNWLNRSASLPAASLLRTGHFVEAVERRDDAEGDLEEDGVFSASVPP